MENDRLHESLVHELNKGKELAKDLVKQLRETSSSNNSEKLVENILSSYNEALLILSGRATQGQSQTVISSSSDPPSSSISLCNATQSKDSSSGSLERKFGDYGQTIIEGALDRDQSLISSSSDPPGSSLTLCNVNQSKDSSSGSLKRKFRRDTWSVTINEIGDDGYSWRKYGQKDILGSKYPRAYYRCIFRHTNGCLATKQIQRSDEDPAVFEVIYRGVHTCSNLKSGIIGERSAIP